MSADVEILKETAQSLWAQGRGIQSQYWVRFAKAGLYEWAVETQRNCGIEEHVPPLASLLDQVKPSREAFALAPLPTPPAGPSKPLSKRRLNRGALMVAAATARGDRYQSIAFSPADFVQFALPHKRLEESVYRRINGRLTVTLTTRNGYTIPFGQDRLFPLWLATAFQAAGQPADNVIRFKSAGDILAAFKQAQVGNAYSILKERIQRWHHTTVDVESNIDDEIHQLSYSLIEEAHLWFQRPGATVNQYTLWQNVIKLNSRFADGLRKNAIPVDFETVVSLRDMPGALDLYIWQAHRSWELHRSGTTRPVAVPLPMLLGQLGTRSPPRKAKQLIRGWQAVIKDIWRDCPNYLDGGRNLFLLNAGQAVFERRAQASLPGVTPNPPVPLRALESSDEQLVLKPAK